MGLLFKAIIGIVVITLISVMIFFFLNLVGINPLSGFIASETKQSTVIKEITSPPTQAVQAPDKQFQPLPTVEPTPYRNKLEMQITQAIKQASHSGELNVDKNIYADKCAEGIMKNGIYPFPGHEYSSITSWIDPYTEPSYNPNAQPGELKINIRAFYAEKEFFETVNLEIYDSYLYLVELKDNQCIAAVQKQYEQSYPYRVLIPQAEKQKALEIAKQDSIVAQRLKEREYKIEIVSWHDVEDLKKRYPEYFGNISVRNNLISLNPQALIRLRFKHPTDQCNGYMFYAYIDVRSGEKYIDNVTKGDIGECLYAM